MLLHLLPLATLLAPTSHPARTTTPVTRSFVVIAALDTGAVSDPALLTPLTDESLKHYIEVKKELTTFWTVPANKALHDSALANDHKHTVALSVPGTQIPSLPVGVFDYADLAAHHPEIAAIFTKNSFAPAQFEPTQVAAFRAVMAADVGAKLGKPVDDAASVAGKNVALVQAHKQELTAVGVAVQMQGGGGGGGGGGDDDLNP
ncbi:MAG TPA: hypothetical protein VNU46_03380 [Gemmatimonadaceae bacterium]|jgi:hypothetical protein|nr:hypothetical protein [Gemmatimonadaceae bacterium]